MSKPLTQIAVDRLRPPARRFEVRDGHQQGLYLVVQPSGAKSWALRTRIAGKPAKLTLGDAALISLIDARDRARDKLKAIAHGEDPRAAKREAEASTLGAIAELYLKDHGAELRPRSLVETRRHLLTHWAPLHARPLAELTRREIAARLLELKAGCGPVAANRARASLSAMYAWAIRQGLAETNPVVATGKAPERARERVLTLEELRTIWQATAGGSDHDAIVRLAILTGARKSEIGSMRWREVDLDRGNWTLPGERTKNGREHVLPLPRQAVQALVERPRRPGRDYVFGVGAGGYSGWSRSKARLDRRCKLAPWTLHDCRRSFVTHLAELGIAPPHVIEELVNHTSGHKAGVAGIYNRARYDAEKARAMQSWADTLLTGVLPLLWAS